MLMCYIDYKSAFGSVSHDKLLHKLNGYGVLGNLLSWFSAFLLNRQQVVDINGAKSDPIAVLSGVQKGNFIGLILFLIYINDACDCIKYSDCKLFVDDLKLYHSIVTDAVPADNGLQSDLQSLVSWSNEWQLTRAVAKTFILHIGLGNSNTDYYINGNKIISKDVILDLCLNVSKDLTFNDHIIGICKRAYRLSNRIFRSFCCHQLNVYVKAYITYVRPILEYASCVWSHNINLINMLKAEQKYFTRRAFAKCNTKCVQYIDHRTYFNLQLLERRCLQLDLTMC